MSARGEDRPHNENTAEDRALVEAQDFDPWTTRFYPREGNGVGFERLVFFSDAVFAIALTLVAVEIGVPEIEDPSSNASVWDALLEKGPALGAYAVAFLWVAFYWRANHKFTATLRGASSRYVFALLVYLGLVALLPFPASMLGGYAESAVAVSFFALFAALVSAMETVLLVVADRDNLFLVPLTPQFRKQAIVGSMTPIVAFMASIPIAFYVSPGAAIISWVVLGMVLGWATFKLLPATAPS